MSSVSRQTTIWWTPEINIVSSFVKFRLPVHSTMENRQVVNQKWWNPTCDTKKDQKVISSQQVFKWLTSSRRKAVDSSPSSPVPSTGKSSTIRPAILRINLWAREHHYQNILVCWNAYLYKMLGTKSKLRANYWTSCMIVVHQIDR